MGSGFQMGACDSHSYPTPAKLGLLISAYFAHKFDAYILYKYLAYFLHIFAYFLLRFILVGLWHIFA